MMKIFFSFLLGIFFFIFYIRYLESRSIFFPARVLTSSPQDRGLPFEDIFIKTADGLTLHGWLVKKDTNKTTLIFFHGNAGNIGDRLEKINLFYQMGLNVCIVDYRGFGTSEGHPSEEGIYQDALSVYDYLMTREDIDKKRLAGYGASLGGAVVIDLAAKRSLQAIIIDSAFTSATDMAKRIYPWVPSFLIRIKFDSYAKILKIGIPKLFIHSREDEIVPFQLGQRLYQRAPDPKEFLEVKGTHNDASILDREKFTEGIRKFLKKLDLV